MREFLLQGRNWLPKTEWANIKYSTLPLPGSAFYSAKNWVGNCPPCPPATYAPEFKINLIQLELQIICIPCGPSMKDYPLQVSGYSIIDGPHGNVFLMVNLYFHSIILFFIFFVVFSVCWFVSSVFVHISFTLIMVKAFWQGKIVCCVFSIIQNNFDRSRTKLIVLFSFDIQIDCGFVGIKFKVVAVS